MKCPICKRELIFVCDTPLCQVCDSDVIYEFNAFVKYDIKEVIENEKNIMR